jgi:hypothetical protein
MAVASRRRGSPVSSATLNRMGRRISLGFMDRAGDESDEVEAALLRRAEAAIDAAEHIRAQALVFVGASASLREGRMTPRCAWCSRYRFEDEWFLVEDAPGFTDFPNVTHGICPDCVNALRASGMSV